MFDMMLSRSAEGTWDGEGRCAYPRRILITNISLVRTDFHQANRSCLSNMGAGLILWELWFTFNVYVYILRFTCDEELWSKWLRFIKQLKQRTLVFNLAPCSIQYQQTVRSQVSNHSSRSFDNDA